MNGREKSDSAEVAVKPANKTGMPAAEQVEPRAGTEGNAIPQSTSPDTGPGRRVTGAGSHTGSCKAQQEGEVHRAPARIRQNVHQ
jgi:hypothetical protein